MRNNNFVFHKNVVDPKMLVKDAKNEVLAEQAVAKAKQVIAEQSSIEWADGVKLDKILSQETVSTQDVDAAFLEKVTYDVYQGRENVPLVYKNIYSTQVDANFPKLITVNNMGPVQVVFVKILEHEGVRFGTIGAGETSAVEFFTYAAGIEVTTDMIEYNETWNISDISLGFGESYNKMLNHVHLDPIISESYTTTGGGLSGQKAAQEADTPQLVAWSTDLATTLKNALQVFPTGAIMLINSFDRPAVEQAIATAFYASSGGGLTGVRTVVGTKLRVENIVEYDGETVVVGDKTYEYDGVAQGFMYLIASGGRNFRELIKHDLRIENLAAEPRRQIAGGQVGVTRRAVAYNASGKSGAIKVDIAA